MVAGGGGEQFEWDPIKARRNQDLHGVAFEEAATVMDDERQATRFDEEHSMDEDRFVTIGRSGAGRLLVVVWTPRGESIRLVSSRPATPSERRYYVRQPE